MGPSTVPLPWPPMQFAHYHLVKVHLGQEHLHPDTFQWQLTILSYTII